MKKYIIPILVVAAIGGALWYFKCRKKSGDVAAAPFAN